MQEIAHCQPAPLFMRSSGFSYVGGEGEDGKFSGAQHQNIGFGSLKALSTNK